MAKATKKQVLGRGLSALLNDTDEDIVSVNNNNAVKLIGNIVEIELSAIIENPYQPRTNFNEESIRELASSIRELGLIQPITVRKLEGNQFQLVSGERRLRASRSIGLKTIPAYVRIADDNEMLEMALVENIQRKDLDPIEVALSFQQLIEEIKLTQEELSIRVGKKRSTVTNFLRLLKLDPIIQTGIRDGFISMGHGRALISINGTEIQLKIYQKILKDKLSVRQTEQLVKNTRDGKSRDNLNKKSKEVPIFIENGIKEMSSYLGHKIEVKVSGKEKGKIIIPFHSEEDFFRIKKLLE
jgi:ParB family chromosome partitioning protein